MKRYLVLAVAALAFAVAAPSAFAVRVRIVDPVITPPPNGYLCDASTVENSNVPCNIYTLGDSYDVNFVACSHAGIPAQTPPPEFKYCLWLNNVSDLSANTFKFSFTVPTGGSLDNDTELFCDSAGTPSVPNFSATNNCLGQALEGDMLSVTFRTTPDVASGSNVWLYTDFVNMPSAASVTATLSVPEPGELGLFGLGLLAIGVGYGWEKRRQNRQSRSVA